MSAVDEVSSMSARRTHALNVKYAWLVGATWRRLHYVEGVDWPTWEKWWDRGDHAPSHENPSVRAICGVTFDAQLPGIFSRTGLDRCAHCCDALAIPRGFGAPQNDKTLKHLRDEVKA